MSAVYNLELGCNWFIQICNWIIEQGCQGIICYSDIISWIVFVDRINTKLRSNKTNNKNINLPHSRSSSWFQSTNHRNKQNRYPERIYTTANSSPTFRCISMTFDWILPYYTSSTTIGLKVNVKYPMTRTKRVRITSK